MKSVATLGDRIGQGAKGGAAATGITAASETLRSVAAVTNALTNTAGVTASIGFSKSKSTTATQESAVVGSSVSGGSVSITARETDITLKGSSITSTGDTNLTAARDVILTSAANQIDSQFKSASSGASLGVTVGVAVVGGVTASASVGVSASKSSGTASETTQANSTVTAGGTLSLTTGRDATLKGAVAEGKDVVANIGRNLNIESVQDTSSRKSTSAGFSAGLTLAPGAGLGGNGSVSLGKGSGSSSIVAEQSALIAKGGALGATVGGNTDLKGGVIAALDAQGKDTGKLSLTTGTLTASDIKDSAKSRDVSVGVSASINNVTDRNTRSANLPVVDGSFASSTFKQDTKATIGQGTLTVGVPDANITINRDIDQSQVVTKDKSTGFTVNADVAALREVAALAKGDKENSVILRGAKALVNDPLAIAKDVVGEVKANTDKTPFNSQLEQLTATVGLIIGALDEKGIARKLANAPLPKEAEASIAALETIADQLAKQAQLASAAGDTEGATKARAAEDEALEAAEVIRSPQFTEANASAIKGRLLNIANPGAVATTRTKRTDGTDGGNATSSFVASTSGGIATGPEGGTAPVPAAGGPKPGEIIIVTANLAREESTVGRVVVDGLSFAERKLNSFSPLTRELAVGGVRAVLTGGTGPLISVAVNQGAGKALEFVPQALLKPIAEGADKINRFVGDGGSSFLLGKDFTAVTNDNSDPTRSDSNATSFGVTTLFGVSLAPIVNKAKALFKKGDAPDAKTPDPSGGDNRASNAADVPRLNAQLAAEEVAKGHAFDKHVRGQGNSSGKNEFADVGVTTRTEFQNFVENIVNTATDVRVDRLGKKYYIDHASRTIVVITKKGESTAFRPDFDRGFEKVLSELPKRK